MSESIKFWKYQGANLNSHHEMTRASSSQVSGPRGLNTTIKRGSNVKLLKRATAMANPVRKPKYIVGIKLDKVRMENPTVTVIEV
jgi:hypothetical protein